jgi:hypothetical protein
MRCENANAMQKYKKKAVIAIQCLIAKAAHPATLQYACTVLKTGVNEGFL